MPPQGNVHVIIGGGLNITVQVGALGAVLVDTVLRRTLKASRSHRSVS